MTRRLLVVLAAAFVLVLAACGEGVEEIGGGGGGDVTVATADTKPDTTDDTTATTVAGGTTTSVAEVAAGAGFETRPIGVERLRNVREPVPLFEVVACPALPDRVIDPVCHMAVDRRSAPGRLRHHDHEHLFCSLECAGAFAADPAQFA